MNIPYCRIQRSIPGSSRLRQLEKPRYVIFGLQTDKKNIMTARKTYFDTCKLSNVKLYLNSEFYLYDALNLDFDKRRAAISYDMYLHFRMSYYQIPRERNKLSFQLYSFLKDYTLITTRDKTNPSRVAP